MRTSCKPGNPKFWKANSFTRVKCREYNTSRTSLRLHQQAQKEGDFKRQAKQETLSLKAHTKDKTEKEKQPNFDISSFFPTTWNPRIGNPNQKAQTCQRTQVPADSRTGIWRQNSKSKETKNTPPPPPQQILWATAIFSKTTSTAYKKDSLFEGNPLVLQQRRSIHKKLASICEETRRRKSQRWWQRESVIERRGGGL